MLSSIRHIIYLLIVVFATTSVYGQLKVKGKMQVSEGVNFVIVGEIEGEENIISHDGEVVVSKVNTEKGNVITIASNVPNSEKSNNKKSLAKKKSKNKIDEAKEELPIKYVNIEGDTYGKKHEEEKEKDPQLAAGNWNVVDGIMTSEITRTNLVLTFDYLLPIYSFKLNKKRFSDYAELYEFQVPTAILRPPIA